MSDNLSPAALEPGVPNEKLANLKQLTMVIYILYAVSPFTGLSGIAAIIINYIKREDTAGTIYASHFTWQIRTFWWSLVWGILGFVTVWIGVGFLILAIDGIWVMYRLIKGFLNWNDGKRMPV
ncbi:putative membrane protein [Pelomonas saccharophila]|uniref:Membrane protein n=1 Tax=Roseateles saccharophilus TaxID=304 RepID=A0ABU1YXI9_ROSSA|nr:hypothetical protein [Roseateles saccharophilus]MDR7272756.1 putative membrane protein [Roseateles saccharophilus]